MRSASAATSWSIRPCRHRTRTSTPWGRRVRQGLHDRHAHQHRARRAGQQTGPHRGGQRPGEEVRVPGHAGHLGGEGVRPDRGRNRQQREGPQAPRHPLFQELHPLRVPCLVLSRRRGHVDQAFVLAGKRAHPGVPDHRQGRRGQAHRHHGHRDQGRHDGERPRGAGARLCPALLFRQGPGQHSGVRGSQHHQRRHGGDPLGREWELDHDKHVLIDLRNADELTVSGKIEGALHIPLHELRDRLGELDREKICIPFCAAGLRATSPIAS
ncbi:MAG: hypothetical protein MZV64_31800 [Ignavibacteriales bacterium]|nr:hypothetical protein [Ignavibacteriales bacterium]